MSAVREAIADAARAVILPDGLAKLTCTGYVPDAVTVPGFFTADYTVDYDRAMNRGMDKVELTCQVLVGIADDRAAQRLLDGLLSGSGPASLKTAIEAARGAPGQDALGGLADDLHVTRLQGYRWYEHQGTTYLGGQLTINIIGEG
ncbi:hypothetical protein ACIRD6_13315 [Streptomyces sp. NPDC102473]|uniref:hypothetical protein n=1 Tax=Streptomyces sp. NPDC102473 TaxID=3366180 RepID=UPI0037FFF442